MEVLQSGVRRYQRAIPSVFHLQAFTSQAPPGTLKFFVYAIKFRNFKPGTDPIQHSASDFLLLSPQLLDKEASTMSVHLNLPAFASVESHLDYCGPLILDMDKVEVLRKFNVWLFHLVLGKCFTLPTIAGEGSKNYYILPCKLVEYASGQDPEELIDWHDVETAMGSGLLYRRKVHYFGGCAKLEPGDFGSDDPPEKGRLRMRNGTFGEHELEDAIVTCVNNGSPCYIAGTLHDLYGSSGFPQPAGNSPMTYSEHYIEKCKYTLRYPNQPLLKGYRLLRAGNYVRRASMSLPKGDIPRPWETMEVPPEVCVLHVGVKGKLCRGAMRLPSVLHSLEMTLLAAELRDHIGPSLSCFKVQEALTSGACDGEYSYETLELLGDSVLKFTGGVQMYLENPSYDSQNLQVCHHEQVRNRTLYRCALARGLPGYIFAELLNPKTWVPPGPALEDLRQKCEGQIIGLKTLADVVEALVGVYLLHKDLNSALKAMAWLQVPISFPTKVPESLYADVQEQMRTRNVLDSCEIATLEKKLGYQFKYKSLLVSAFDYGGEITFNDAGNALGGFGFQRLEFLGNAVLEFLLTWHLVKLYPRLDPEGLNHLRQASVNSENLSCVAIRHGLQIYLQKMSPNLKDQIDLFVASVCEEGASPFGVPSQNSPRAIGDLMQTLAGAIFLDSDFDIKLVWKVLEALLRPLATPETVMLHPRRELEILCNEQGLTMEVQSIQSENEVEARVYINKVFVASARHHESAVARRLAAFTALRLLSRDPYAFNLYGCMDRPRIDGLVVSAVQKIKMLLCGPLKTPEKPLRSLSGVYFWPTFGSIYQAGAYLAWYPYGLDVCAPKPKESGRIFELGRIYWLLEFFESPETGCWGTCQ